MNASFVTNRLLLVFIVMSTACCSNQPSREDWEGLPPVEASVPRETSGFRLDRELRHVDPRIGIHLEYKSIGSQRRAVEISVLRKDFYPDFESAVAHMEDVLLMRLNSNDGESLTKGSVLLDSYVHTTTQFGRVIGKRYEIAFDDEGAVRRKEVYHFHVPPYSFELIAVEPLANDGFEDDIFTFVQAFMEKVHFPEHVACGAQIAVHSAPPGAKAWSSIDGSNIMLPIGSDEELFSTLLTDARNRRTARGCDPDESPLIVEY